MSDRTAGRRFRQRFEEAAVILLSILAAFALDSWWAERGDRRALDLELRAVQQEMAANRDHFSVWLGAHQRSAASIEELLAASTTAQSGSLVQVPDTLLVGAMLTPTINPSSGALRMLLESGRLALVNDLELRMMLAGWEDAVADVIEEEQSIRTFGFSVVGPWVRSQLPPADYQVLTNVSEVYWRDPAAESALPWSHVQVGFDGESRNMLLGKRRFAMAAVRELSALIGDADRTLQLLEEQLR